MADRDVVTRTGVGVPLSASNYDQNVNSMSGTVEEITAATHTIAVTDQNKTIEYNRGTAIAVSIPTAATIKAAMDSSVDNFKILLKNINAGVVTVTSTDNIDGALTLALNQWDSVVLQTNPANDSWLIVSRDMDVVDINGGTIDNAAIGGSAAAAGAFTTLTASSTLGLAAGTTVNDIDTAMVGGGTDNQLLTAQAINEFVNAQGFTTIVDSTSGDGGFIEFEISAGVGIQIAWGTDTVVAQVGTVTFANAFSATPWSIVIGALDAAPGGGSASAHIKSFFTSTGFSYGTSTQTDVIHYVAFGPTTA